MIIDGRHIANEIIEGLATERAGIPGAVKLGVVMTDGDAATASFVRIKERVASRLRVELVREILPASATTDDAIAAVNLLAQGTNGIIVQLPLPATIDTDAVLRAIPTSHDVDVVNQSLERGAAVSAAGRLKGSSPG